jgi:hypothetical protein
MPKAVKKVQRKGADTTATYQAPPQPQQPVQSTAAVSQRPATSVASRQAGARTAPVVPNPAVAGPTVFNTQPNAYPAQQLAAQGSSVQSTPPAPSFTQAPAPATAPVANGSRPKNVPQPFTLQYRPQSSPDLSSFSERECRWLTPEALKYYEPLVQPYTPTATAFIPWPMYYSQAPEQFCPSRFRGNESEFEEWAFQVPFVKRCGSDLQRTIALIPYSDEQAPINDFVSSPYQALRYNLVRIQKERAFGQHTPWCRLTNRWISPKTHDGQGEYLPKVQLFRLIVCVMLASAESVYVKNSAEKGTRQSMYKNYYQPQTGQYGKGVKTNERLTCIAVSEQVWRDFSRCMNTATLNNEYAFANPVDPRRPAIFYSWAHKKGPCPIPGQFSTTANEGSSGIVSGSYYFQQQLIAPTESVPPVSIPPQFYCSGEGGSEVYPSSEYYAKTLHIGQAVRRLNDLEMACELAEAFCDARAVFEVGWKGTSFEDLLNEREFQSKFENIQQTLVWSESVFEGAPVSLPVQLPEPYAQRQQQQYPPPPPQQYALSPTQQYELSSAQQYVPPVQVPQQQQYVQPAQVPQQPQYAPPQYAPAQPQYAPSAQPQYPNPPTAAPVQYGMPQPQVSSVEQYAYKQQQRQDSAQSYQTYGADYSQVTPEEQQQLGGQQFSQQDQPDQGGIYRDETGYQCRADGSRILDVYGKPIFIGFDNDEDESADSKGAGSDSLDSWQAAG